MSELDVKTELEAIRAGFRVGAVVISGLLVMAIGGWVVIGINDHYSIKSLQADMEVVKP